MTKPTMKPFNQLTLMDDFLFSMAAEDTMFCKCMLQAILGKRIVSLKRRQPQKEIKNQPGLRGIRVDLLVEDDEGRIYNVEVQIREMKNLPKRSRFYQGLIDQSLLISGEKDFDRLNDTYLIMICSFDPFGADRYCYTFENLCEEDPEIHLNDGAKRIFLNTRGTNSDEVSPELIAFLEYVEDCDGLRAKQSKSENLAYIQDYIGKLKASKEIGVAYMQSWEKERMLREEGREEGRAEGREAGERLMLITQVCKKIKKGQSSEEIANALEEDPARIRAIYDAAVNFAPEYNREEIYKVLYRE